MLVDTQVVGNIYRDSVSLMRISSTLCALPDVSQAYCVMATQTNLDLLRDSHLLLDHVNAGANDILIAVQARDRKSLDKAFAIARESIKVTEIQSGSGKSENVLPRSIEMAIHTENQSNMVVISTPGPYAASEALKALSHGLNVMIFSDNVSLADEVLLKRKTQNNDLLVMGPDCGTAIIDGIPFGFANAVARGPIGLVGASGTGLQQLASLIDRSGAGISQAIGVGSRDLSEQVCGLSTLKVLRHFKNDPDTNVIVLVSKPSHPKARDLILRECDELGKPVVACLLGDESVNKQTDNIHIVSTLESAARKALEVSGCSPDWEAYEPLKITALGDIGSNRRYLRGLYCGGTFCLEAFQILRRIINPLYTNVSSDSTYQLTDLWKSKGHVLIDLGDDVFTRGRPHPMIDHRLRNERLRQEALDPETAVILFDVVLGTGSNPDPVEEMAPILKEIGKGAELTDSSPLLCSFVCGTENDSQSFSRQCEALRHLGVSVFNSSTEAARAVGQILASKNE